MQTTDSAPQTDTLLAQLRAGPAVPQAVFQAAQRALDLEQAVLLLRNTLAAMPVPAARTPENCEEIARLLAEVALFRIALADKTACLVNKEGTP